MPETEAPAPPTPGETEQGLSRRAVLLIVGAAVLVIVIIATVFVLANRQSPFDAAVEACELESSPHVRVMDDGDTLAVDTEGNDSGGASIADLACVLTELDVPGSVMSRMDSTRALDGTQDDEFDGITVRWSYHPDNGLDAIFTR